VDKFQFPDFIVWAFCGLISGCAVYIASGFNRLNDSVKGLHETLARLLEKMEWHERELNKHEDRISELEKK